MLKHIPHLFLAIALVLLQVFLIDNIDLGSSISIWIRPMIFPIIVLLLPTEWSSIWVLIASYIVALTLDLMLGGAGLYVITLLPLAIFRPALIYMTTNRSVDSSDQSQLLARLPLPQLMFYIAISLLLYHILFFATEALSWANFMRTLSTILLSSIASLVLSWPIVRIFTSKLVA